MPNSELLLGAIALREGLITRAQLFDALSAQERNPAKNLGSVLVTRGWLKEEDIQRLLQLQQKSFGAPVAETDLTREAVTFGKILVRQRLATAFQVNECLRMQGQLSDAGITPVPQLGEIMVHRAYISRETVETVLQLQNLALYVCPSCNGALDGIPADLTADYPCPKCGASVPLLFARMAAEAYRVASERELTSETVWPVEVREAARDPKNHFDRYILIREIARGGTGIIHKAWQKDLNKTVALKLLSKVSATGAGIRTPYGDAEDIRRFYLEVHAAGRLRHPNIVPIHDVDLCEDVFFFSMELIDGETLERVIYGPEGGAYRSAAPRTRPDGKSSRAFEARKALELILPLADALEYAHRRGVIHRDIKPQNVMIDRAGVPYLMDFGLARERKLKDIETSDGSVLGTPWYMAPEQAEGRSELVDAQSDVYSLGAVLYEMIAGETPFAGAATNTRILQQVVTGEVKPPSRLNPDVDPRAEAICLTAMARHKRRRYRSAEEFADEIRAYLRDRPLRHTPTGFRRWILGKIYP